MKNLRPPSRTSWNFARMISPRGRGFSRWLFENLTVLALLLAAFSLKANLLDDFNDNTKTAWSDTANGGTIVEAGAVFTITSSAASGALTSSKKTSDTFTNAAGHTIEVRVDVNSIGPAGGPTNGHAVLGWVPSGALNSSGYSLSVGIGDVTLYKAGVSIYRSNLVTTIQNTNLLLIMRMATTGSSVAIRASVYKKGNGNTLLFFDQTVTDVSGILGSGQAALGALNDPSGSAASAVFDNLKAFDIINGAFSSDFSAPHTETSQVTSTLWATSDGWRDSEPINTGPSYGTINNTNVPGELEMVIYNTNLLYVTSSYYNNTTFKISDGGRLEFAADVKNGSANPVIIPLIGYLPNGAPDLATLAVYFLGDASGSVVAGKSASGFWFYQVGSSTVKSSNVRLIMNMSGEGAAARIEQRIEDLDVDVNDPARIIFTTSYFDSTDAYTNKSGYFAVLVYHDDSAAAGANVTFDNVLVNRTAPGNQAPVIQDFSPADGANFSTATNLTFNVADDVNTPRANIILTLNGVRYTNGSPNVSITPTFLSATLRTFTLSNLTANTYYNGTITATDAGTLPLTTTAHYEFDTFSTTNLTVEVEDYNFSTNGTEGGVFIDNPTLVAEPGSSSTSYNGVTGLQDIDFHDNQGNPGSYGDPDHSYRSDNPRQYHTGDGPRKKYTDAGGAAAGFYETQLASDVENGDWENYTRTFPAGTYNAYLRMGNYNMKYSLSTLERVTSNPKVGNQTTRLLGYFMQLGGVAGDAGYDVHRTVPLTDASGNRVVIRFPGGVDTVRLHDIYTDFHSDTFQNYIAFAPVADPGTLRPIVALASPIPGSSTRVSSMPEGTYASIVKRDTTVNVGTVALKINGAAIPSAIVASDGDGGATVAWSLTNVPGTQVITNTVSYTDSDGTNLTYSWTYSYPFLSASNKLALGSLPLRGFAHHTAQDDTAEGDSLVRAEGELAGDFPVALNAYGTIQTLDWNNDNGIPHQVLGLDSPKDYIATEDLAYLELTAGGHRFRVDSDDGFQFRSGSTPLDLGATILAQSDGDTFSGTFDFVVEADGLYPVRNIWYEQGGGAAFHLYSYNFATSANVVVNNPSDPAGVVKAYLATQGVVLFSAAVASGPYTPADAVIDTGAKTVIVPLSGSRRFYRLSAPTAVTITGFSFSGSNVILTYQ